MEDWKKEITADEIKRMVDEIRKVSEQIEIPDELTPEAVEKMLKEKVSKGDSPLSTEEGGVLPAKKKSRAGLRRYARIYGGAAAAAAVVLLAAAGLGKLNNASKSFDDVGMAAPATAEDAAAAVPEASGAEMMEEDGIESMEAAETTEETPADAGKEAAEDEAIARAGSYEEIYRRVEQVIMARDYYKTMTSGAMEPAEREADGAAADDIQGLMNSQMASEESAMSEAGAAKTDYSATNQREKGVDEADIIKTDGTYIYTAAVSSGQVQIVKAADLSVKARVSLEGAGTIHEIYVENDRLTILSGGGETALSQDEDGLYYSEYQSAVTATVYDIRNPEKPVKEGAISQEGEYRTSRKVGAYLYLFTDCWKQPEDAGNENSYIPKVNGSLLASDSIYLPQEEASNHYILISSVNLNDPSKTVDSKGILCNSQETYISKQHIYITQARYGNSTGTVQTEIFKFRFFNGKIWSRAIGLVDGMLQDSFCIDEYQGDLRLVTTKWDESQESNGLYILDDTLELIGQIRDIAPGEEIKSARLMGDTGYFVTFRQTDPLFCVDLSDPEQPKILGELKVSGFSSYLHPYGSGKLLGMGQEADVNTGRTTGGKLSMFDVSEPGKMEELDKEVFRNVDLAGLYNYKTVLADAEKNIIGICLEKWDKNGQSVNYRVYSYQEEKGFVKLLDYEMGNNINTGQVRGLYIGNTLYVTSPTEITAFSMENGYEKTGSLTFENEGGAVLE